MDYARMKGRATRVPDLPEAPTAQRMPPGELSETDRSAIAKRKAMVHAHIPEMVPFLRDLIDLGLATEWRNVVSVTKTGGEGESDGD